MALRILLRAPTLPTNKKVLQIVLLGQVEEREDLRSLWTQMLGQYDVGESMDVLLDKDV